MIFILVYGLRRNDQPMNQPTGSLLTYFIHPFHRVDVTHISFCFVFFFFFFKNKVLPFFEFGYICGSLVNLDPKATCHPPP